MARFRGTFAEFHRFHGPHVRNLANAVARRDRKALGGRCQHCQSVAELDSAHIHGSGRREIIENVLCRHLDASGIIDCDLHAVEREIVQAHQPVSDYFVFLCKPCHRAYDRKGATSDLEREPSEAVASSVRDEERSKTLLPVDLIPADVEQFKRELLVRRRATIRIHYTSGRVEQRPWIANSFAATSNVFGNIRSRPEFRQGHWQALAIVRVVVAID